MKQRIYWFKHCRQKMIGLLVFLLIFTLYTSMLGQERTITGSVTDQSGAAMIGVNVVVKGTTIGVVTDINGKYELKVPDNNATIAVSFIGYLTQEFQAGNQTVINVILQEEVKQLNEVVVVGYGVQKKSDLTGSIASISGQKLKEMPILGVDQAIQGRAAGVNVVSNTGMPGGTTSIQINGISSMNGTDPLIIIDGIVSTMDFFSHSLSPGDIESIEILKDASSAAIYGSAGGNGVILVTTKKGKSGKTVLTFDYYRGVQTAWKHLDVCNSQQYVEVRNNFAAVEWNNTNKSAPFVPYSDKPDTFPNYDWQNIMFREAVMENYDISVSGGNDKSSFMISAGYLHQEGILRNSDFKRFNARINSDHTVNSFIKVGENANFVYTKLDGYSEGTYGDEYGIVGNAGILTQVLTFTPFTPAYDDKGDWAIAPEGYINPKVQEDIKNSQKYKYNLNGNAYVDITPFKGLIVTSKIGANVNFGIDDEFKKVYDYPGNPTTKNSFSSVYKLMSRDLGWTWQNYANYSTNLFSDHNIGFMIGYEAHYEIFIDMSGTRWDTYNDSPEMWYFDAARDTINKNQFVKGGYNNKESSTISKFGRFNYDYKGILLTTFNFRQDQSSRFGPRNRTGNFPSFSAGIKFSELEIVKENFPFLSFGKIRGGWGKTGANAPEPYRYIAMIPLNQGSLTYDFDHASVIQGAAPIKVPNQEIRWEQMAMTSFGIDLGFLKNKINFTAEYFERKTSDMLYYQPISALSGAYQFQADLNQLGGDARPLQNAGSMTANGVTFTLGYKKMEGELTASFDFNISFSSNKMKKVGGDSLAYGRMGVNFANFVIDKPGHPIAQFYGYKTDGIYKDTIETMNILVNGSRPKPGDLKFVDMKEDSIINDKDKVFIGDPSPKFTFGFTSNFEYKGFDLTLFFQGSYGNKLFNGSKYYYLSQGTAGNYSTDVLKQYREPIYDNNGTLVYPGYTNTNLFRYDPRGINGNTSSMSDFFIEDGSYIRLKNIQFGYTIPKKISQKFGVESLRLYVGAKNLWTYTNYTGFDPEIGKNGTVGDFVFGVDKGGGYPQAKMLLMGLNLKF